MQTIEVISQEVPTTSWEVTTIYWDTGCP